MARQIAMEKSGTLLGANFGGWPGRRLSDWRGGAGLSGRDRGFSLFLGQQFQEQLPLGVVFDQSEPPSEDFQVFAAYEFFHGILLSGGIQVGDLRSWPASQRTPSDFIGSFAISRWSLVHSNISRLDADGPGALLARLMRSSRIGQFGLSIDASDGPDGCEYRFCMCCNPADRAGALRDSQSPVEADREGR
jgi:hypothetical protein